MKIGTTNSLTTSSEVETIRKDNQEIICQWLHSTMQQETYLPVTEDQAVLNTMMTPPYPQTYIDKGETLQEEKIHLMKIAIMDQIGRIDDSSLRVMIMMMMEEMEVFMEGLI